LGIIHLILTKNLECSRIRIFSILEGSSGPVPSQTQGHLPDRARLGCGQETGHSYLPLFIEKIPGDVVENVVATSVAP